ncbi:hypothetical protein ACWFMI_24615 [Nocardiopsis terrae]|uniref:hypothetical protein n=1 Tax=Streptomyces sp. NPDC057554 TaxID=3350538 RepID=UPI0036A0986E
MTATTDFGTWYNHAQNELTIESDIANYISGGDLDWVSHVMDEGYLDRMAETFRAQINAALPDSVSLCGNDFYGPYYAADRNFDGYPTNEHGDLDITAIIRGIDLAPIVERHDPDLANQDATLSVGTNGWHTLTTGDTTVDLPVRSNEAIPAPLLHQLAVQALAENEWEPTSVWERTPIGFTVPVTRV